MPLSLRQLICKRSFCRCQLFRGMTMSRHEDSALAVWSTLSSANCLPQPASFKQHNWDKVVVVSEKNRLLSDNANRARLLAVSAEHSSDWLNALPISSCGLRLSDEAIGVAVVTV